MACCAAAVFFISQIVFAFDSVRRRLFGAQAVATPRNDAVAWTLSTPRDSQRAARPRRGARRLIVAAVVGEALLIAGSAAAWTTYHAPSERTAREQDFWSLALKSICSSAPDTQALARLTDRIEGNAR
jgi:hypothetical protein